MLFANLRTWLHSLGRWEKAAIAVWCAILLFVSVRAFLEPARQTVYPIFSASGRLWWAGGELYDPYRPKDVQDGYRYAPTCAVLFTPLAFLPDALGGVLWRLVSTAALFGALAWFARAVLPGALTGRALAWMFLLLVPLSIQSVNNGQANLVVIAFMLGAIAAVHEDRWNLAGTLIALAFVFKLYPLALGMMLILLYPRQLGWRIPLACLAGLVLPFLFQQPAYVVDQYQKWIAFVRVEDRSNIPLNDMYRDLWLLIHLYGLPISRAVYVILQVAGGAVVALLCWQRQRAGWPTAPLLAGALALTTAWMMLLGPATESSSFALLAPSFAWSVVEALQTSNRSARHGLLWCSCGLFAVAILLGGVARNLGLHEAGVHAWASLCYFVYLLTEPRVNPTREQAMEMSPTPRLRIGLTTEEVGHRVRT